MPLERRHPERKKRADTSRRSGWGPAYERRRSGSPRRRWTRARAIQSSLLDVSSFSARTSYGLAQGSWHAERKPFDPNLQTQREFRGYMVLLNYWRDEAAHGSASMISEPEACTSLMLLVRLARYADETFGLSDVSRPAAGVPRGLLQGCARRRHPVLVGDLQDLCASRNPGQDSTSGRSQGRSRPWSVLEPHIATTHYLGWASPWRRGAQNRASGGCPGGVRRPPRSEASLDAMPPERFRVSA